MDLPKICPNCEIKFEPRDNRQKYCCTECKDELYKKGKRNKYPLFICPHCGVRMELPFNPLAAHRKWESFKCTNCGEPNIDPSEDD